MDIPSTYLSFALDSGQAAGAHFWNPDSEAEETEINYLPYDFNRPLLHTLAAELAPAILRVGGTEADRLYYETETGIPAVVIE